jgi:hypothetical protein
MEIRIGDKVRVKQGQGKDARVGKVVGIVKGGKRFDVRYNENEAQYTILKRKIEKEEA